MRVLQEAMGGGWQGCGGAAHVSAGKDLPQSVPLRAQAGDLPEDG